LPPFGAKLPACESESSASDSINQEKSACFLLAGSVGGTQLAYRIDQSAGQQFSAAAWVFRLRRWRLEGRRIAIQPDSDHKPVLRCVSASTPAAARYAPKWFNLLESIGKSDPGKILFSLDDLQLGLSQSPRNCVIEYFKLSARGVLS